MAYGRAVAIVVSFVTACVEPGPLGPPFGAVALNEDGTRGIAGPVDTADASVRVISRSGHSFTLEAILTGADVTPEDAFGASVAISADGATALVGAPDDDRSGSPDAGTARVFVRTGSGWSEEAILENGATFPSRFGHSLALSSDGSRALVGALHGPPVLFVRTDATWTVEAELPVIGSTFGSVALSADGTRAVAGVLLDRDGRSSAPVFTRSGSTWAQEAVLIPAGAAIDDWFGIVALSAEGDVALVGGYCDDTPRGADAGSVRVFVRTGTTWAEQTTLPASVGGPGDELGRSLALSADGARALVGAPSADAPGAADVGRAHLFSRSGATWREDTTMTSAPETGARLAAWVAMSGDGRWALVGSHAPSAALVELP